MADEPNPLAQVVADALGIAIDALAGQDLLNEPTMHDGAVAFLVALRAQGYHIVPL